VVEMAVEQRKEKRTAAHGVSHGELYHPGTGQYVDVTGVHDISTYGICLHVGTCLEAGEKVRLGYKFGRTRIQSYGFVAWCAPTQKAPGLFMMGISL